MLLGLWNDSAITLHCGRFSEDFINALKALLLWLS
ncbi:hypothetical protein ACP4OV_002196 [Aristida adscensionis]